MFEKLRSALSSLTSAVVQRTLSQEEVEEILRGFELNLLESDVAQEVVDELSSKLKAEVTGAKLNRLDDKVQYIGDRVKESLKLVFAKAGGLDVLSMVKEKRKLGEPFVVLFLGINGTGKTTTIAKFAYLLKRNGFSVVFASADTHRAGAIEQLSEHARRLSVKVVSQGYGADPAAVARDAVLYAKSHHLDVVLIDTAGRMQTSRNLMEEMRKIVRVAKPDLKLFVGDSLTGNDAVSQAKEFQAFTDFDAAVLTKADADAKGGAAVSITYVTGKPIVYLGVGQSYKDLEAFDVDTFLSFLTE